ncbi:MAG: hypothetical protein JWR19_1305 [Pedosphaera sp.]|nr:hypothetical protein [Pedosphaera sp.]
MADWSVLVARRVAGDLPLGFLCSKLGDAHCLEWNGENRRERDKERGNDMKITVYGGSHYDRSGKIRRLLEELGVKYGEHWLDAKPAAPTLEAPRKGEQK